jgi:hypothetical protein
MACHAMTDWAEFHPAASSLASSRPKIDHGLRARDPPDGRGSRPPCFLLRAKETGGAPPTTTTSARPHHRRTRTYISITAAPRQKRSGGCAIASAPTLTPPLLLLPTPRVPGDRFGVRLSERCDWYVCSPLSSPVPTSPFSLCARAVCRFLDAAFRNPQPNRWRRAALRRGGSPTNRPEGDELAPAVRGRFRSALLRVRSPPTRHRLVA